MQFKKGDGWKACYDEERDLCTAGVWGFGLSLYEISREIYDTLKDGSDNTAARLIGKGRKLYKEVNDRCGPPYTIVFDKNYRTLCPWVGEVSSGPELPGELVDAALEMMLSEENEP